ncbi:MAG: endonuclease III [Chloroflexi bacterium]|nr:endonuclease III [Chloroflexota bacterium]
MKRPEKADDVVTSASQSERIDSIVATLHDEYGPRQLRPDHDPVSTLVATVLSQNTSDANSQRAFTSLVGSFRGWEAVAEADVGDIASVIRSGGLAETKARRIKLILQEIRSRRGTLDIGFLGELPLSEARSWLMRLPGVGPKTASCVLLFSLGRPALPVDTHVFRVARRLGLIDSGVSVGRAHDILERIVRQDDVYPFHMSLVEHGRRVCKAQRPRCHFCVLEGYCPSSATK